jgi:hypothetical protein
MKCVECGLRSATHPYDLCQRCYLVHDIVTEYRNGKRARQLLDECKKKKEPARADV